ncbi:hydrogenase expression/formation protein HypE [Helicobacter turcicus]|uniref:Hydrogenase expression/formation protein HypE n=1 Tax=Helicobacter turcicus TaxID=2867412 RepID=A0ABS7JMU9_9HELI|nr:hydrogenase expression/formation protein HypE [Helicobacter turcicus]MBX7490703.1 hydrogenase expression/formation protein HypE [Helicobacter turcicus]MBX7545688.1 hydrogenase expression/formation protein HypE [Helicobacter turcicus]
MKLNTESILLSHGSGGAESQNLIAELFYPFLESCVIGSGEDAGIAQIHSKDFAVSTDGYVISPIFFAGGDIGKLSICGSCNDVAMMGAKACYLTASFMLEEGFKINDLSRIVESFSKTLKESGAKLISADTKVLPKGALDKIFITTTAIGEFLYPHLHLSAFKIPKESAIIVSGNIGTHGAVIYSNREGINLNTTLESDCALLYPILEPLFASNLTLYALRDATRGGIASVLNEWAQASNIGITILDSSLPILPQVQGICELLGFEAYNLANEGMCVICIAKSDAQKALEILHKNGASNAAIIGYTTDRNPKRVVLETNFGAKRFLDYPSGELLPRIC